MLSVDARGNDSHPRVELSRVFCEPRIPNYNVSGDPADACGLAWELQPSKVAIRLRCMQPEDRIIEVVDQRPAHQNYKSLQQGRASDAGRSMNQNHVIAACLQRVDESAHESG